MKKPSNFLALRRSDFFQHFVLTRLAVINSLLFVGDIFKARVAVCRVTKRVNDGLGNDSAHVVAAVLNEVPAFNDVSVKARGLVA